MEMHKVNEMIMDWLAQSAGEFPDFDTAAAYLTMRDADAAALLSEMKWDPHFTGVLRCSIYEHSILWDLTGNALRMGVPALHYEILPAGSTEVEYGTLQQVLAFILRRNW